jgi:oligopeptide transport system ATP-binding protein
MSREVLLQLDQVCHVYDSREKTAVKAVDSVSFSVCQGETFGLVGESGCGKTTTGKMIVKLLDITSGTITYRGQDITALSGRKEELAYRQKVQMIFQDPYASLDPRMKVKDIIAEGIKLHHLSSSREETEKMVETLLNQVGLQPDHATRYPHEFSGGQRQRIGIARALAVQPEFIVCDEPISALDVSIQAQVVNLLKNLQKEKNLTYLFIAHDLSMVKYISDRIGVMCKGKLVELGKANDVYNHPLHPYTQSLISAIPIPDPQQERQRRRVAYEAEKTDRPITWTEAEPEHFVLG